MAVIDGTVKMSVKDADLVSGGQKMAVIDGTVKMNVKDADLVLVRGGQKMAVIDGTVNMNKQDKDLVYPPSSSSSLRTQQPEIIFFLYLTTYSTQSIFTLS